MMTPRSAFIFLTALAVSGAALAPAQAGEKKAAAHKESATWNFDSFGDWFQEMGEGFSEAFSGPKRTAAPFKWTGKVAAGKTFEVRGINGPIRAAAASGSDVELVAIRSGRRNDPESVKIEIVPHVGGVTVCAVYPSKDESRPNECKPGGGRMSTRNNDTNVEFELRIPKDVNFEGRTVNGSIKADIEGRAALSTVNGRILVNAETLTEATTVNGSIRAEVRSNANSDERDSAAPGAARSLASGHDIRLQTVNGSVHLKLPEGIDADVSAKTVNGGISSEFAEIEVRKKWGPRSAEGRLGHGGRELALATVNGGIRITKGN